MFMSLDYVINMVKKLVVSVENNKRVSKLENDKKQYHNLRKVLQDKFPGVIFSEYTLINNSLGLEAYFINPEICPHDELNLFKQVDSFYCQNYLDEDLERVFIMPHYFKDVVNFYIDNVRALAGDKVADLLK